MLSYANIVFNMDPPLDPPLDELTVGFTSDESSEHPNTPADVSRYYVQPRNGSFVQGHQPIFNIGDITEFNPSLSFLLLLLQHLLCNTDQEDDFHVSLEVAPYYLHSRNEVEEEMEEEEGLVVDDYNHFTVRNRM
jgi:hypothetical protein